MAIYLPHKQGIEAERAACLFLEERGLHMLCKNFRTHFGEIDLIMKDQDDTIVFVEVRSRGQHNHGHALESIEETKIQRLTKTATLFLQQKAWLTQKNSRFDVVAIEIISQKMQIEWVKNAF